ncbi:septum site-determining protein MinC [Synechococcus sp. UW140]|uniref:septum site-determining protein MinC n=1 Tax=Synechococcus sp. UW140 TaxID=368503 RepID=UPI0025E4214A|nr:septum site-determining protein MinC [Synechococcus sp. UW140]
MVARLMADNVEGWPHNLELGAWQPGECPKESVHNALGTEIPPGLIELHCNDWPLDIPLIKAIQQRLNQQGLILKRLTTSAPTTLVAAKSMGLNCEIACADRPDFPVEEAELKVHRGTLRAGDHLEVEGSVLVLGDVNPGAKITATKHILIWGRLRGIAHAGCSGNKASRIIALQLRPLQLRIADAVARGPEELPAEGYCEQAELIDGEIRIKSAEPTLPS